MNTKATSSSPLFPAETCLSAVLWRPRRRDEPLFTVQRCTAATLELPLQSVPLESAVSTDRMSGRGPRLLPGETVAVKLRGLEGVSWSHRQHLTANPESLRVIISWLQSAQRRISLKAGRVRFIWCRFSFFLFFMLICRTAESRREESPSLSANSSVDGQYG